MQFFLSTRATGATARRRFLQVCSFRSKVRRMNIFSIVLASLVFPGETPKVQRNPRLPSLGSIRLVGGREGDPQGHSVSLARTLRASSAPGTRHQRRQKKKKKEKKKGWCNLVPGPGSPV